MNNYLNIKADLMQCYAVIQIILALITVTSIPERL